jgi:uncharacterized transporter YbjL
LPDALAVRVQRGNNILPVTDDLVCEIGDVIVLVGGSDELTRMAAVLLGPAELVTKEDRLVVDLPVHFETMTLTAPEFTNKPVLHETIKNEYGIEIRGFWRGRDYHHAEPWMRWRVGDRLRVLGIADKIRQFRYVIEEKEKAQTEEIDLLRFSVGAVVAVLLGGLVIPIGETFKLSLGLTGAPLLAGLVFGRSGRILIPRGAGFFLKELGLILFLAQVGTTVPVHGMMNAAGALITVLAVAVIAIPMILTAVYLQIAGFSGQHAEGGICGAATSATALVVSCRLNDSAEPANTYAGIYLFALVAAVVAAQVLYVFG